MRINSTVLSTCDEFVCWLAGNVMSQKLAAKIDTSPRNSVSGQDADGAFYSRSVVQNSVPDRDVLTLSKFVSLMNCRFKHIPYFGAIKNLSISDFTDS